MNRGKPYARDGLNDRTGGIRRCTRQPSEKDSIDGSGFTNAELPWERTARIRPSTAYMLAPVKAVCFVLGIVCSAAAARVPVVGCPADGQAGPVDSPPGGDVELALSEESAPSLAYYRSTGLAVLGPRGWYCLEVYGSGGATLWVTPELLNRAKLFSGGSYPTFPGAVIQLRSVIGDSSGRDLVADVVAQAFPAHLAFVDRVRSLFHDPASKAVLRPARHDRFVRRSQNVVEYETPQGREGLGTDFRVLKSNLPIKGVVILLLPGYDLVHLHVRLPGALGRLAEVITRQVELEAPTTTPEYQRTNP